MSEKSATSLQTIFDNIYYLQHIEARGETIRGMVNELKPILNLSTALDVGCGVGFFAKTLQDLGLAVRAFDGRTNNIEESCKRFPGIPFEVGDIEDSSILRLGAFDFVLCFGLLYHLENPLRAIRHLRALTGKALLLESMCIPVQEQFVLLREEPVADDQSLTDMAFYPSEGGIVKMLYRAGFVAVYRIAALPNHDDFQETSDHTRRRTVLLAAQAPLRMPGLILLDEPHETVNPWDKKRQTKDLAPSLRVKRFLRKPWGEKIKTANVKWYMFRHSLARLRLPVRLRFGAWWVPRKEAVGEGVLAGTFETGELAFVDRFLKPGMTVLDIGAHHGLYTLLASRRVGSRGRVFAFEPSPRERSALRLNVRLNKGLNLSGKVTVQEFAVGNEEGEVNLFVGEDWAGAFNSLRPPNVSATTSTTRVHMVRLDDWLARHKIDHVDFIKLDIEGAELGALRGAQRLLEVRPRPVLLVEVYDIRTQPWGYQAREIVQLLDRAGYRWFSLREDGAPYPVEADQECYDANLVAVPSEDIKGFVDCFRE